MGYQSRFGEGVKTFKVAIRHNRQTTRMELERFFCRWIYSHSCSKIFLWPSYGGRKDGGGGGAIAPSPPMDLPQTFIESAHCSAECNVQATYYQSKDNNNCNYVLSAINSSSTHTHTFNGPLFRTTRVSRYQKGKTNLFYRPDALPAARPTASKHCSPSRN